MPVKTSHRRVPARNPGILAKGEECGMRNADAASVRMLALAALCLALSLMLGCMLFRQADPAGAVPPWKGAAGHAD